MTLHQAIEKLIKENARAMTAGELAAQLNQNKWYVKGDGSPILPGQIIARVNNYPLWFSVDRTEKPLRISRLDSASARQPESAVEVAGPETKMVSKLASTSTLKTSFAPIADKQTRILILGSLPGMSL